MSIGIQVEVGNLGSGRSGRVDLTDVQSPSMGRAVGQGLVIDGLELPPSSRLSGVRTLDQHQALIAQQQLDDAAK